MAELTNDPNDPRLGHGIDTESIDQHDVYLVLSEEARSKGFVRPYVERYVHSPDLGGCGIVTHMGVALSETYAREPSFYGATYCCGCRKHLRVGGFGVFHWCDINGHPLQREGTDWKVGT